MRWPGNMEINSTVSQPIQCHASGMLSSFVTFSDLVQTNVWKLAIAF